MKESFGDSEQYRGARMVPSNSLMFDMALEQVGLVLPF